MTVVPVSIRLRTRISSELRCAICHGSLAGRETRCRRCSTRFHAECGLLVRRCPSLGCPGFESAPGNTPRIPRDGWLTFPLIFLGMWIAAFALCGLIVCNSAVPGGKKDRYFDAKQAGVIFYSTSSNESLGE
jgi:hypothetical protein